MLKIKEAREAKNWTQERLAAEMSTTQQTIQRWETGQTDVKSTQIKELSRILGVTVTYLMGVSGTEYSVIELPTDELVMKDERELLDLYRKMDDADKAILLDTARRFAAFSGEREECRELVVDKPVS